MSSSDVCEKFPPACTVKDGEINPIVDLTDPNLPIWGKQGQWVLYKQQHQELQKELEETKKKLTVAEAELAARKQDDYAAVKAELEKLKAVLAGKGNLMAAGLKACADVTFTPKTP